MPRPRKRPSRYENGSEQHRYSSPKDYHRHQYYEACDLLYTELNNRFQSQLCSPIIAIEQVLLKAANGDKYRSCIEKIEELPFKDDINLSDLNRHLQVLPDVIKKQLPEVKKVTSINTICQGMDASDVFKDMLPTVHKLLRLYLTLPITSATSERAMKRIMTTTRSQMTQTTLNNCFLLHVHKDLTDGMDLESIAKEFISATDERVKYFGNFDLIL